MSIANINNYKYITIYKVNYLDSNSKVFLNLIHKTGF